MELRFSFASARKQAQGLHFGLSERGKVARGGIVVRLALMTHRTPRASCIMLLVHGILAVHMLICFSRTPAGDNAPLAPASRRGQNPVLRGVSPRARDFINCSFVVS